MENIKTSAEIKDLIGALAKAQGELQPAVFNRVNPHFKTRYADFTSCMDACRGPLSSNGLAVIQTVQNVDGKLVLVTMLAHTSGQWMTSEFPLVAQKMDAQGIGSAMTYAKRYSLCGIVGIVADEEEDDDGNAAIGRPTPREAHRPAKISSQDVELLKNLFSQYGDDGYMDRVISRIKENDRSATGLNDMPKEAFVKLVTSLRSKIEEKAILQEKA